MTQEELGAILGVQKSAVQKIESGMTANLCADKIRGLCETFNTFPSKFLYDTDEDFWIRVMNFKEGEESNYIADFMRDAATNRIMDKELGMNGFKMFHSLLRLNDEGVNQVRLYVEDLTKIEDYRKSN